jgi:hypothetical protein
MSYHCKHIVLCQYKLIMLYRYKHIVLFKPKAQSKDATLTVVAY